MLLEVLKRFFAFLLAVFTCLATMNFTMGRHYCGGQMVSTAIIALDYSEFGCGMQSTCEKQAHSTTFYAKNCCKTQYVPLSIDGEYLPTVVSGLPAEDGPTVAFELFCLTSPFRYTTPSGTTWLLPRPPLSSRDRLVLHQTFLI